MPYPFKQIRLWQIKLFSKIIRLKYYLKNFYRLLITHLWGSSFLNLLCTVILKGTDILLPLKTSMKKYVAIQ